ncbi:MAG: hypothetical protein HY051_03805 [Candidatus Aenigmarchaeota archaeon]|nr:hypothetical protein [Candidatus Aenigmarchaeota archaeon]
MDLVKFLEERLAKKLEFGISLKGREAAEVRVEKERVVVEIKNPVVAAQIAVRGYAVAKNLKKLKSRIIKASKNVTVKYGPLSFDV